MLPRRHSGSRIWRDVALAWGMALLILAVAAGGLRASRNAQRAEAELRAQRHAAVAARQVSDWLAQREAALVGLAAVGRGLVQVADESYMARALPDALAVGWWDHHLRKGDIIAGTDDAYRTWLLTALASQPFNAQHGTRVSVVDLPSGGAGVLIAIPEAQGEAPWQTVIGAGFDLNERLATQLAQNPQLLGSRVYVHDNRGMRLFGDPSVASMREIHGTAFLPTAGGNTWQVHVTVPPAYTAAFTQQTDLALFATCVTAAFVLAALAWRMAGKRGQSIQALRDSAYSNELQRRALEASNDAVLMMDDTGRIQWCNPAAEDMFRLPAQSLRGQLWGHFLPRELGAERWQDLSTTPWPPRGVAPGQVAVWEAQRADDTTFPAEVLLTAYRGTDAQERTIITAFVRDVTKRLQLEQRTQQAERLESLGRLAGGVAHDFKNILAIIVGRIEMLRMGTLSRDAQEKSFERIDLAVDSASELVTQLLAVARQQPSPPKSIDFNAIVERHAALVRQVQCKHAHLDIDLEPGLPQIIGDASQIGQIVMNLCVNAGQATPPDGDITVRTRMRENGRLIALEVIDSGSGIDPEHLPHLFEPFYTTKDGDGGTGLGLATVYGIVQAHGGTIDVESELGKGTHFTIVFPAIDPLDIVEPRARLERPQPSDS